MVVAEAHQRQGRQVAGALVGAKLALPLRLAQRVVRARRGEAREARVDVARKAADVEVRRVRDVPRAGARRRAVGLRELAVAAKCGAVRERVVPTLVVVPLFAEASLVPVAEPESPAPTWRYDESAGMNVRADGLPFVETGIAGATETLTEVRAEQDDFDRPDEDRAFRPDTGTKVRHESDDFSRVMLGTETRSMPGEQDDFARAEHALGTETAIGGEADDFAQKSRGVSAGDGWDGDTKTSVRSEADDFAANRAGARRDGEAIAGL